VIECCSNTSPFLIHISPAPCTGPPLDKLGWGIFGGGLTFGLLTGAPPQMEYLLVVSGVLLVHRLLLQRIYNCHLLSCHLRKLNLLLLAVVDGLV